MYLRCHSRTKNGKRHRYFTISESRRIAGGKVVQRRVLHLGEINDSQKEAWQKSISVFDESKNLSCELSLFSEDQVISPQQANAISLRVSELSLHRPRAFGDCWLGCRLWEELGLSRFWREKLGEVRGEVAWEKVLQLLAVNRDNRGDCRQVVIALVVTPDGLPMAYEVLAGNTSDKSTLKSFLAKIESQFGKARRVWVMDRGRQPASYISSTRWIVAATRRPTWRSTLGAHGPLDRGFPCGAAPVDRYDKTDYI